MNKTSEESVALFFKADHERLDKLFIGFQTHLDSDRSKAKQFFLDFKSGLERHIRWEEELLFPIFERKTGMTESGPTAMMRFSHRQFNEALSDIHLKIKNKDAATVQTAALMMSTLCDHNQKEETVLYPMIEDMISAEEREEIFRTIKKSLDNPQAHSCCCEMD